MSTTPPQPDHVAPERLAEVIATSERPVLVGLDIDGVLAPIVDHADDAVLLDGIVEPLTRLAAADGLVLAAVSGRTVESMQTFGLPDGIRLVGSHGMEEAGRPIDPLDATERARLDDLVALADAAAELAGDGAWVEHKAASVAVHVRQGDHASGERALERLTSETAAIDGATSKAGSAVLELFARQASKGTAMSRLRDESGAATAVFIGDDVTDEDAFAALVDGDVTIKVGPADTIARFRLDDPDAVRAWLRALAERWSD